MVHKKNRVANKTIVVDGRSYILYFPTFGLMTCTMVIGMTKIIQLPSTKQFIKICFRVVYDSLRREIHCHYCRTWVLYVASGNTKCFDNESFNNR